MKEGRGTDAVDDDDEGNLSSYNQRQQQQKQPSDGWPGLGRKKRITKEEAVQSVVRSVACSA